MKCLQMSATAICLMAAVAILPACGGSSGGGDVPAAAGSTLRISVTDAPFPFDLVESASVVIREVQVREKTADSWTVVFAGSRTIDLVPLTNGVAELLVEVPIEPGTYDEVRLIVEAGEVVLAPEAVVADDHIFNVVDGDLLFPSGAQSGIKVKISNDIVVTTELSGDLMLDFSLDKNFVFNGPMTHAPGVKRVLFTPVVRAENTSTNGTVTVTVLSDNATPGDDTDDFPIENATVALVNDVPLEIASGPTDAAGQASFSAVPGTYSLTATAAAHDSGEVTGAVIALANVTDAGTITLVASETELTGVVLSDGATPADTNDDSNIQGADVSVIVNGDVTATVVASTTTDLNGAFVLPMLAPGQYDVTVSKDGWTSETRLNLTSVLPGTPGAGLTFVLVAAVDAVTGTVADGVPVAQVGVSMTVINANLMTIAGPVLTDGDGVYTLTGIPSGVHTLRASNGDPTMDVDTTITVVGDDNVATSQTVNVVFPAP